MPRNVMRSFYRIIKKAGLTGLSIHSLRHTYVTRLFENGIDKKVTSKLLGRASVTITQDI